MKPGFTVDNPPDLHQVRTSTPSESRNVHYGGSAQFIWRPAPSTVLRSLFAARKLDYDVFVDSDSTELNLSTAHVHEIHHQVSEELTITSELPGFTATGGLFLFKEVDRQPTDVEFIAAGVVNRLNPTVDTKSIAAFGQVKVALGSRISGIIGVRYSRDDKTMDNFGVSEIGDTAVSSFRYLDSIAATAWTPKFGLDFRIADGALAYVSATRGFKSGGFNPTAGSAGRGFAPEWAWTYEAGFKSRAEPARQSERRGVLHGLRRPASANAHSSWSRRYHERGDGDDPRCRGRRPGSTRARMENGWTRRLARRPV